MLAAIPYTTFPTIDLGPLNLRTFGVMVALGVLVGAWIAAAYGERFGVPRDDTYRVATWMVLAGVIGSRLTWAATHTDQIENPIDVIAIWEGGIQFSGGFIAALVVGLPFFRRWSRLLRWQLLDGYALGLSIGLAMGRVGCYAVGEHFGRTTDIFLATRYDGGDVRESTLGDVPLVPGTTFHNTSLYELIYMLVLFGILGGLVLAAHRRGREVVPGTLIGLFVLYYGVLRFLSDSLRVNDERVAGMTGAQWMCLVMVPAGAVILWKVRPRLARLAAAEATAGVGDRDDAAEEATVPDEVEAPDDEPAATEAPAATEEPAVGEEPATSTEPASIEEPAATAEPAVGEEPAGTAEPAAVEEPAATAEPAADAGDPGDDPDAADRQGDRTAGGGAATVPRSDA